MKFQEFSEFISGYLCLESGSTAARRILTYRLQARTQEGVKGFKHPPPPSLDPKKTGFCYLFFNTLFIYWVIVCLFVCCCFARLLVREVGHVRRLSLYPVSGKLTEFFWGRKSCEHHWYNRLQYILVKLPLLHVLLRNWVHVLPSSRAE